MKGSIVILFGAIVGLIFFSVLFLYFTNFTCPYFGFKCVSGTPAPVVPGPTPAPTAGSPQCPPNSSYDQTISDCRCSTGYVTSTDGTTCIPLQCS